MMIPFRALFRNMFHLGSGEIAGRLCSLATVVLLGHRYGVVILGIYGLALSLAQYLQPLIDFGLRHVGARLVALYPQAGYNIVLRVQRRRLRMAALVLPLTLVYAACVKLPVNMKIFLFAFAATGALYAISLDWVAWGQGKLYLVGLARSAVPLSILLFLAIGASLREQVLWWAVGGNAFGFLLQGSILWRWWRRQPAQTASGESLDSICAALAWRRTSIMGLAWLCNLAFNTIDVLMLGLMSNPEQLGLYSAAYRLLNQVLVTYYLLTQVLYPSFVRHRVEERGQMLRACILLPLAGAGILIAAVMAAARETLLTVEFGHQFLVAGPLLLLLAWSVPFDFVTSYLSNAYIAWGMEKKILLCTGIGAAANVALNLALIPGNGARGAAISTLLSYAIFLAALGFVGRTVADLSSRSELGIAAVGCLNHSAETTFRNIGRGDRIRQ
jgi:O-antigen/teichoic acid export membrane protein